MRSQHIRTMWFFAVVATYLTLVGSVEGGERAGRGAFGVKVGWIGTGEAVLQWKEAGSVPDTSETHTSASFGVFFERPLVNRLRALLSIDIHKIQISGPPRYMLDGALGLKYSWTNPAGIVGIRPAMSIGYAVLPSNGLLKSSTLVTVKSGIEVVFYAEHGTGILFEVGALYRATGGSNLQDMSLGPMLLARAGLLL